MHLTTIDEVKNYGNAFSSDDNLLFDNISNNEILSLVEQHLMGEERSTYIKVKGGAKVSKADMDKLVETIREIIRLHG